MPADFEDVAVAHAFDRSAVAPMREVDGSAKLARHEYGAGRVDEKSVHTAALVGLEMAKGHIGKPLWIEHLRHGGPHGVVGLVKASVDQGRALVIDQELVEADRSVAGRRIADAIDTVDDLADLRHVVLPERFPVRSCQTSGQNPTLGTHVEDARVVEQFDLDERM